MPFRGQRADDCFSRRGLLARFRAAGSRWPDVLPAAVAGRGADAAARQVFAEFGADLGQFLQPFAAEFQAQAVLVLGGLAGALDLFEQALQETLSAPVLAGERGAAAALLGAAELIYNP
jgi:glucokinase